MSTEMHVLTNSYNGHRLVRYVNPPEPFPAYTLRLRFADNVTPTNSKGTLTQVSSSPNVWDWTYNNANWTNAWKSYSNLLEVIDGNTSNVTNMYQMFYKCTSLTSVPLFDTSNVTDMRFMFQHCTSLTSVPLFNTSNVTNMQAMFYSCGSLTTIPLFDTSKVTGMAYLCYSCDSLTAVPLFDTSKVTDMYQTFYGCTNVESGALALYQQASSQTTPPSNHNQTFTNCGSNTVTGAAELAQIPSDWK